MKAFVGMVLEHPVLRRYKEPVLGQISIPFRRAQCPSEQIPPSNEKGVAKVVQLYVVPVQTHTTPRCQFHKPCHVSDIYDVEFVTRKDGMS